MIVKNNLPTVLDFGNFPNGTTLKDPGGKNHGVKIPGMQLLPGNNEVDAEAWAMWTTGRARSIGANGKPAGLNWHLQQKHVEVVKVEVEPADSTGQSIVKVVSSDDFADLNASDAIDLVKETFTLKMLKDWFVAEEDGKDRTTVLSAISDQISVLEAQVAGTEDE